ncbi:MAG TPA: preprotein translocase subunit SecG [Candidatus Aminicenantes bacterium]|nr:preprotein translocase subunit SecG [Candidatus Aminicenantes bacterium]HRY66216.1 preprotein translocase subunit SecG [Candidatus Aminicenantes bacterium]HRZ73130.1 preprotein translocase subunit SecG [Candidatus Aminicenantes bacterium]
MSTLIIILHVIVCLFLILVVLLQSGKAADLAGAFGGGGSQTAFGGRGSQSLLSKLTTASAILFMLTSLGLWIVSGRSTSSVVGGEKAPAAATVPAAKPEDKSTATAPAATPAAQPEQQPAEQTPAAPAPAEKK